MNLTSDILKRKVATVLLVTVSIASFATLGDGRKKTATQHKSLLTAKTLQSNFKTFSLKSGYTFRGNTVFSNPKNESNFIMLNTTATYQKGNTTFIMPIKKKVLINSRVKINFNATY